MMILLNAVYKISDRIREIATKTSRNFFGGSPVKSVKNWPLCYWLLVTKQKHSIYANVGSDTKLEMEEAEEVQFLV
ncbi:hypothetical protein [Pedobacter sp. SYSU D00535]|uniref:hypothetical protein n=1 Tax=Pedobacter sp. SYSU D00535 TaxID=2810308 RepID=UPI001A95E4FF|nr:hypothetical protein [Pedobacter sp. SYSU D00535]